MSVQNQQPQQEQKPAPMAVVKHFFDREDVKKKFNEILGKRSVSFMTSVFQIVANSKDLVRAEPTSIYQAAVVAATLDLPINNNLGFAYIIAYEDRKTGV